MVFSARIIAGRNATRGSARAMSSSALGSSPCCLGSSATCLQLLTILTRRRVVGVFLVAAAVVILVNGYR